MYIEYKEITRMFRISTILPNNLFTITVIGVDS